MPCKVYIVTGASGIAAETIKLLAIDGHHVFYVDIEKESCVNLLKELEAIGKTADYIVGDLTNEEVVNKLVSDCINKYRRIDGLFNVAGLSGRKFGDGPLHECTLQGWEATLKNNLTTQFMMCSQVLNQMRSQTPDENGARGVILNISSVLAFSPKADYFDAIAYATGKGAIVSMTKSAAAYYAKDKIRINVISPGLVLTKMSARASENEAILNYMKEKQPLVENVMHPKDVAKAAVFLLSDAACMITGEMLVVDAGWSIS